jgi:hypothetical protein
MPLLETIKTVVHHFRPASNAEGWQDLRGGVTVALAKQADGSVRAAFSFCKYSDDFVKTVGHDQAVSRLTGPLVDVTDSVTAAVTIAKTVEVQAETEAEAVSAAVRAALAGGGLLAEKLMSNLNANAMTVADIALAEDVLPTDVDGLLAAIRAAADVEEVDLPGTDEVRAKLVRSVGLAKAVRVTMIYEPVLRDGEQVGLALARVEQTEEVF